MVITKENKGNIIYDCKSGAHYHVDDVVDQKIFCTDEAGFHVCIGVDEMEYSIQENKERLDLFHRNATMSDVLSAAAASATRKLRSPELYPEDMVEDAIRVLEIVEEQRAFIQDRIKDAQRDYRASSKEQTEISSLDARLESANARTKGQQKSTEMQRPSQLHSRE